MEEFMFWLVQVFRFLKVILPFLIALIFALVVLNYVGVSITGLMLPMVLIVVIFIGFELKNIFKN
jgi:hypothetical protein